MPRPVVGWGRARSRRSRRCSSILQCVLTRFSVAPPTPMDRAIALPTGTNPLQENSAFRSCGVGLPSRAATATRSFAVNRKQCSKKWQSPHWRKRCRTAPPAVSARNCFWIRARLHRKHYRKVSAEAASNGSSASEVLRNRQPETIAKPAVLTIVGRVNRRMSL